MPVATLVFKSRISPFSPFLAFGRSLWVGLPKNKFDLRSCLNQRGRARENCPAKLPSRLALKFLWLGCRWSR